MLELLLVALGGGLDPAVLVLVPPLKVIADDVAGLQARVLARRRVIPRLAALTFRLLRCEVEQLFQLLALVTPTSGWVKERNLSSREMEV